MRNTFCGGATTCLFKSEEECLTPHKFLRQVKQMEDNKPMTKPNSTKEHEVCCDVNTLGGSCNCKALSEKVGRTQGKWAILSAEEYNKLFDVEEPNEVKNPMVVSYDSDNLPWTIAELVDGLERGYSEMEANAAHIVLCVNSYEKLVEAVRQAHAWTMADAGIKPNRDARLRLELLDNALKQAGEI